MLEGFTIKKTSLNSSIQGTEVADESLIVDQTDFKIDNEVARASLVDDSYWRQLDVDSENGTVCSY